MSNNTRQQTPRSTNPTPTTSGISSLPSPSNSTTQISSQVTKQSFNQQIVSKMPFTPKSSSR